MARSQVGPDASLELIEGAGLRSAEEESAVKLLGGVSAGAADGDPIVFDVPLENGAGDEGEALAYLSGDRDLSLSGELGPRELHTKQSTTVMNVRQ